MAERMEIERIRAAVADDHASDATLAEGVRLAQEHGAEPRLVHVVDTAPRSVGRILPDLEAGPLGGSHGRARGRG